MARGFSPIIFDVIWKLLIFYLYDTQGNLGDPGPIPLCI